VDSHVCARHAEFQYKRFLTFRCPALSCDKNFPERSQLYSHFSTTHAKQQHGVTQAVQNAMKKKLAKSVGFFERWRSYALTVPHLYLSQESRLPELLRHLLSDYVEATDMPMPPTTIPAAEPATQPPMESPTPSSLAHSTAAVSPSVSPTPAPQRKRPAPKPTSTPPAVHPIPPHGATGTAGEAPPARRQSARGRQLRPPAHFDDFELP